MSDISIITVSLNSADYLQGCIESVQSQSIAVDHIVIDGGSTDNSPVILAKNSEHLAYYCSEVDGGIYDAMNKGLYQSKSKFIGFLNSDDCYADNRVLEKVVERLNHVDICYGDLVYVSRSLPERVSRLWKAGNYSRDRLQWGWMPPHPAFFARREVFEQCGNFRLDLGTSADYELMLRFLTAEKYSVDYIPEVLVRMRLGGVSNGNIGRRLKANYYDRKAWEVNDLKPLPWTFLIKPLRKISQWFVTSRYN